MLEKQKDIEGVLIATPDHMHAPIALAAMELGKHVYVQKPLTWCVAEARQLAKRARETHVATQMGNQGHSLDDARKAVEYIWARRDRRSSRNSYLDQPAAGILAAGGAASRKAESARG